MASTHPLPLLASLSARAVIRGAALTRTRPGPKVSPLLTVNARAIRHYGIGYRDHARVRLLSPFSALKLARRNATTNAGKGGSSSQWKPGRHKATAPTEDEFKIGFRDLGMNRVTKFVVYTVIGVLGTMETIFWCKVLWRWQTGEEEGEEEGGE